jgi:enoyl reductase
VIRKTRITSTCILASGILLLAAPFAYADQTPGGGGSSVGGGSNGQQLTAGVSRITFEPAAPGPGGAIASTAGWTPPACWMEPQYTAEQLQPFLEGIWAQPSVGFDWVNQQRDYYVNGNPHKDFEIPNSSKGLWWDGVPNPSRIGDPASLSCFQEHYEWVLTGNTPKAGTSVDAKILAEAAYDRIRVPDTAVSLSPSATQTVNLATWAWLDKATFHPVSVTARLDALGIQATTTATPIALHIDPGTSDADVYPASGDCTINNDGSIGTPYATGDENKTPPCGLIYRRSSSGRTFPLKATITWKISWTGSGGSGGNRPDGTFGNTTDVTVQEAQTVNR